MSKLKILYGVQATGNGHISRARMMAKHFAKRDADVTFLFSGRDKKQLFSMDAFGHYLHHRGLTFTTQSGEVKYWQTVRDNNLFQFFKEACQLDVSSYDLVISDFEPVTAWAAKLAGKISIGIGHQYAFDYPIPMVGQNLATKLIMSCFAPTQLRIGLHWHHFDQPILPPIINTNLTRKPSEHNYRLVYLPLEDQSKITQLLNQFPDHRFIQYAPSLEDNEQGNTLLRKNCLDGFRNDLRGSAGVICNSGFALISECLHMGLPVLTKPLVGQMEQLSNAEALIQLGLASVIQSFSKTAIEDWLNSEQHHQQPYPDVAASLVDWLLVSDWNQSSINALKNKLWGGISC